MPKPYAGRPASVLDITPREFMMQQFGAVAWIGGITVAWSRLEALLARLYALLVFGERKNPDIGETIALDAFETAAALGTKRKLLLNATALRVSEEARAKFSKLLRRTIQDAYDARNEVIHARWALNKENQKELIRLPPISSSDKPMVWELDDFVRAIDKIADAERSISKFFIEEIAPHIQPFDFTEMLGQMLAAAPFAAQDSKDDA